MRLPFKLSPSPIGRLISLVLGLWILLGCAVQPAPPPPAAVAPKPSASAAPSTVPSSGHEAVPPAEAEEPTTWTIGLLDQPGNILPFSPDGRAAAPIVEALFPSPVLGLNYTYTTTGVLETLPTIENGGVEVRDVPGFLDATGQFTLTETTQPTTTQQLIVTFHWNPALHWADGTPLTAADSVFAYELWGRVEAPQEAQVIRAMLDGYEQVDEHTTRAVLKPGRIDPNYLLAAWPPLPRHRLADKPPESALAEFGKAPLGYGPFTFAALEADQAMVLERNEYWPDRTRLPTRLRFRFFASADELRQAVASGAADAGAIERIPEDLYRFLDQDQQSGATKVAYLAGPVYEHLDVNLADQRLQDVRVRQAIAHAINRAGISQALFGGKVKPLESWVLPEQQAFYAGDEQLTRYGYDPNKARALLDAAGIADKDGDGVRENGDGKPFDLKLLTTDSAPRKVLAQRIADDLKAVGIRTEVTPQPVDQFYSATGPLYRRDFQLALFAWIAGVDPGGLPLWSCNAIPMPENAYTGNNFGGWCFEAAEWPLRRANATLDQRIRAQSYLKQQQLWTQEVPAIPLMQRPIVVLHRPGLKGIKPDPLAPLTWNVSEWHN